MQDSECASINTRWDVNFNYFPAPAAVPSITQGPLTLIPCLGGEGELECEHTTLLRVLPTICSTKTQKSF